MTVNANSMQAAMDNVRSTGNTPAGSATTSSPAPAATNVAAGSTSDFGSGANVAAAQMALSAAQNAANQAYLNARLNLETDQFAFQKAQQAFTNEITKAGLTGMYGGAPTLQAMQQYATQFGTWGAPAAGQQTLEAQQQAANLLGTYQGQQTLVAQQQAYNQWLQSQQEARLQQQQQQQTAQGYLNLLSQLRGPADWMQYQKVLGSTPQGMSDLVRAAAGQYVPGGGATTGVQPQAANLQTLLGSMGQPYANQQAAMNSLVAPNQMAPQTWNALTNSQQQMLLGAWEGQGYTQEDAKQLFQQSLPKYATQSPATGTFRLQ